jgi:hypothetical protein
MPRSHRDDVAHLYDHVIVDRIAAGQDPRTLDRPLSWKEMRAVVTIWFEKRRPAGEALTGETVATKLRIRHTDADKLLAEAQGKEWIPPLTLDERIEQRHRLDAQAAQLDAQVAKLDEIYGERAELAAFLAACFPLVSVLCRNDDKLPDMPVLYVNGPTGQVTWHIAPRDLWMFEHVQTVEPDSLAARMLAVWDEHNTVEKRRRVRGLTDYVLERGHGGHAKTA